MHSRWASRSAQRNQNKKKKNTKAWPKWVAEKREWVWSRWIPRYISKLCAIHKTAIGYFSIYIYACALHFKHSSLRFLFKFFQRVAVSIPINVPAHASRFTIARHCCPWCSAAQSNRSTPNFCAPPNAPAATAMARMCAAPGIPVSCATLTTTTADSRALCYSPSASVRDDNGNGRGRGSTQAN